MNRIPAAAVAVVLCSACASTTTIRSFPHGAKIKNESGHVVGVTPYEHTDSAIVNHAEKFVVEKEGFETEYVTIRKDQPNVLRIAGGVLGGIFIPPVFATLLWATDYKSEYSVQLSPAKDAVEVDVEEVEAEEPVRPVRKKTAKKPRLTRR